MWPDTIAEWTSFIIGGIVFLSTVVGFIWRTSGIVSTMQSGFKQQGERIGRLEQSVTSNSTAVSELKSKDQSHEFKMLSLSEAHGEIRGRIDQLISTMERNSAQKNEREIEIAGRLARIEERLDLFPKMLELMRKRSES